MEENIIEKENKSSAVCEPELLSQMSLLLPVYSLVKMAPSRHCDTDSEVVDNEVVYGMSCQEIAVGSFPPMYAASQSGTRNRSQEKDLSIRRLRGISVKNKKQYFI